MQDATMKLRVSSWSIRKVFARGGAALVLTLAGAAAASAVGGGIPVSQKGRAFQPGELALKRGDKVTIVNDDGDLLHHAYIDTETFTFDSGDQEPGSKTDVVFSVVGDFKVLCGIHPKMKLLVHVR
jgi:plastocyanin